MSLLQISRQTKLNKVRNSHFIFTKCIMYLFIKCKFCSPVTSEIVIRSFITVYLHYIYTQEKQFFLIIFLIEILHGLTGIANIFSMNVWFSIFICIKCIEVNQNADYCVSVITGKKKDSNGICQADMPKNNVYLAKRSSK